ncbi:MAG: tetratricopeptide repeat protein [Alphaproteobacteria bacterium]|nr:tetratricopeptide repeat protein [Alphaproteobacteria bacterium]
MRDYVEAVKWYRLAAEQGHAADQHNLGVMYLNGDGVPQGYVRALMWFSLTGTRSPPGKNHDRAVQGRDDISERMTPGQIAEAENWLGSDGHVKARRPSLQMPTLR